VGGAVTSRSSKAAGAVDKVRSGYRGALKKAGFHKAALKDEKKADEAKEAKMEMIIKELGDTKSADLETAKNMAMGLDATDEKRAYYLKSKIDQGKILDDDDKKLLPSAKRALGRKSMDELVNKDVGLATETDEGKKNIKKLMTSGDEEGRVYTEEEAKRKVVRDKIKKHVEDGTWKKYNAGTWNKYYGSIQKEVNNDKVLRDHYKTAGKEKQESIKKGAENNVTNTISKYTDSHGHYVGPHAEEEIRKARESAAAVTGDIRAAYGERDYDEKTGESKLTDKRDADGNIKIDTKALEGSVDKLSENFKNFNTDSKKLFGQYTKGVSGLDLKGQSQADIDALIDGLRSNTLAVRQEAASNLILGQRIRARGLTGEFGIGDKENKKKKEESKWDKGAGYA